MTDAAIKRRIPRLTTILSIQSHVVFGHVGNSAAVFALQRSGCETLALNTVQFSSHAGYKGFRGERFQASHIDACVAGLQAIDALRSCDGVLSGYLGAAETGEAVLRAVAATKAANPLALYCCDPVIGDLGRGAYVSKDVADVIRTRAVPAADVVTPNAFELETLVGRAASTLKEARTAVAALQALGPRVVLVTSLMLDDTPPDALDLLSADGRNCWRLRTPNAPISVRGAGDLIAALFFFHLLSTRSAAEALKRAASSVYGVVAETLRLGRRELALVAAQEEIVRPSRVFEPEPV